MAVSYEASYFDQINITKNGLEYHRKNSHGQTWKLELDRKITPTNLNCRKWPKYGWIWAFVLKRRTWTGEYYRNKLISVIFTCSVLCSGNIYYIFGQVQQVMFVGVNFLVMFKFFGHIHSVILNWSSDYSLFPT